MKYDYIEVLESDLESIDFQGGSLYRTTDTGKFFMDPVNGSSRILVGGDYCAYIDDQISGLNMIPKFYVTISALNYDNTQMTGTHVNIYNVYDDGTKVLYDQIAYEGEEVSVILPKDFKYYIELDEIPGYYAVSKSGIIKQTTKLSFKYMEFNVYGVTWDKTSTTVLARTGAASLFEEPVPYISGASSYGSPFDDVLPWAGMTVTEDSTAGTVVAIPKFWFKWTTTDSALSLQIANSELEGFSVSPAHRDRGDGKGERDVVYIGRYHCSTNNYKSETGVKPKASVTRANFRTNIHALGENIYQNDYALFWTLRMLYLVEYANWNAQTTIGYGCGNGSSTEVMGYTDSMPYCTGTMLDSRTTYGVGTQYRNIEGLWDNVVDWCDGIYFSGANVYGINNPNNFSDTENGTLVCTRPTSSGYIKDWQFSTVEDFDWFMYPSTVGGSSTTYVADYCNYFASGVVLCVGGSYSQNQVYGAFFLDGFLSASDAYGSIGSRLMLIP